MADKTLSQVVGSGGSLPQLTPDLTAPTTWNGGSSTVNITGIDPSTGLTTVLSIPSGKGYIPYLTFLSMLSENYTIKLTVDGEVIYNDVWTVTSATPRLVGAVDLDTSPYDVIPYNTSLLLEVQSTTDTDIGVSFINRLTK